MLTGNKGDWSEIYAFLKILGDKRLYAGNTELEINPELFFPVIKIIRFENDVKYEYTIVEDSVIITGGFQQASIPIILFQKFAYLLLDHIHDSTGVFSVEEMEEFMIEINCRILKAKSGSKTDIFVVIHDLRTNQHHGLGFSIKSKLGEEATLLNAGQTTNFIYKLNNFNPNEIEINDINEIEDGSKIKNRIEAIKNSGGTLQFIKPDDDNFKNNLVLIDSWLPHILAEIILLFFTSKLNTVSELTAYIAKNNPLGYDRTSSHKFYEYKIKRFLTDVALGMTPSKVWSGVYDATGGYLVVKENGELICYHTYNLNQFENYLFSNTKLETASSTRHQFGKIYKEADELYFKLNLQIRFK